MSGTRPTLAPATDNSGCADRRGASESGDDAGRQRKRGADLEQAIRDATIAELNTVGYGGVTIESVAARAQTGKASIYRRWPTKQDLVVHSLGSLLTGPLLSVSDGDYPDTVTTQDALVSLVCDIGEQMAGPSGDAMRSIMSESLRDVDFSTTVECDFFEPRRRALRGLLDRGISRGEVRPDVDCGLLAEILAGALIHRVLIRHQAADRGTLARLVREYVMPGLAAPDDGRSGASLVGDDPA